MGTLTPLLPSGWDSGGVIVLFQLVYSSSPFPFTGTALSTFFGTFVTTVGAAPASFDFVFLFALADIGGVGCTSGAAGTSVLASFGAAVSSV